MCNPYLFTCRPVNLSTCLPRLTRPEANIGEQGIMGNSYLFTCLPVNLFTRVDRTRDKYRTRDLGFPYLFTCRPVNLSTRVDRSRGK